MASDRCACGATHRVAIDTVVIADDAVEQLGAYVRDRRWSSPFVVMDVNTGEVLGSRVIDELSRGKARAAWYEFPERENLLADEPSVSRIEAELKSGVADVLVAVGSGVITDLTRFVANRRGLEFVSVPTAASMDGYASSVAAMEFAGMKTTLPAVAPVAIFADPSTVAAAPPDMTRAGLGDLLGKATARVDWLIAHELYGEPFCPEVERRVSASFVEAAAHVDDILGQTPRAIAQLLHGLIESGVAMAMMGSSRPASGCEHHASHLWDMLTANGRRPHASHGLQVGYATHFAMRLQGYAFGGSVPALVLPSPVRADGIGTPEWLTSHAAPVDAVLEDKRRYVTEHQELWPTTSQQWVAIQGRATNAMEVFPLVSGALHAAGIPSHAGFLDIDAATLKLTFRLANRMRARYTTLDFLEGQGILETAIDAVVP